MVVDGVIKDLLVKPFSRCDNILACKNTLAASVVCDDLIELKLEKFNVIVF